MFLSFALPKRVRKGGSRKSSTPQCSDKNRTTNNHGLLPHPTSTPKAAHQDAHTTTTTTQHHPKRKKKGRTGEGRGQEKSTVAITIVWQSAHLPNSRNTVGPARQYNTMDTVSGGAHTPPPSARLRIERTPPPASPPLPPRLDALLLRWFRSEAPSLPPLLRCPPHFPFPFRLPFPLVPFSTGSGKVEARTSLDPDTAQTKADAGRGEVGVDIVVPLKTTRHVSPPWFYPKTDGHDEWWCATASASTVSIHRM